MKQAIQHLFVYGSLRSGFKSPAYYYISQYFSFVTSAKAKGILYDMGSYPVAKSTTENKFVIGELYLINEPAAFDFVIAQLDDYEGINSAEDDEISLYERKLTEIKLDDDTTVNAYVYWYCGNTNNKPIVSSGDTIQYFLEKNK